MLWYQNVVYLERWHILLFLKSTLSLMSPQPVFKICEQKSTKILNFVLVYKSLCSSPAQIRLPYDMFHCILGIRVLNLLIRYFAENTTIS